MLPIVLCSQFDDNLAQGLAFALGQISCQIVELEKKTKSKKKSVDAHVSKGIFFKTLPTLNTSVERGVIRSGGKKSATFAINVLQMNASSTQRARAMSAWRLTSAGNGIPGRVVVVEGQSQGTVVTVIVDGELESSIDIAVPHEEEAVKKAILSDTVCVIFLGDLVDEIALCWPEAATPDGHKLKSVAAKTMVHRQIKTETVRQGFLHRKKTVDSEIDKPFRLLNGAPPDLVVFAFRKIRTNSGKVRKPGLGHYFEGPFVFVGPCSVRVIDGMGGYFRYDLDTEKRSDWKNLAPKILKLAAGIDDELF